MSDLEKLDHVDYEPPRDPNWWKGREMTEEEKQVYQQALDLFRRMGSDSSVAASCYCLLKDGGGFGGIGITHSEWPKRILLYVAPFKGRFSEEWKQQTLQQLDRFYAEMKREIEEA